MSRGLRIYPLDTVQNVGIEIARIYRKTKKGEILTPGRISDGADARRAESCLESAMFEQRIANLEAQADSATVQHFRPKVVA